MAKYGVFSIFPQHLEDGLHLKSKCLLFDKLAIDGPAFAMAAYGGNLTDKQAYSLWEIHQMQRHNLIELVKTEPIPHMLAKLELQKGSLQLKDKLHNLFHYGVKFTDIKQTPEVWREFGDWAARVVTAQLRMNDDKNEYFPLLNSSKTLVEISKESKLKEDIYSFLLNEIPVPDESVSWEHIVEFKSDEDVRNKYYALIRWVNTTCRTISSFSEIEDEYNSLYSDYCKAFNQHKMKASGSILEVITKGITNVLTSPLQSISAVKEMFSIKRHSAELLQEEADLKGKEVAYIYHANKAFHK